MVNAMDDKLDEKDEKWWFFQSELEKLINYHGIDSELNEADFKLADRIVRFIKKQEDARPHLMATVQKTSD
jgi:hypothetical protein